MLNKFFNRGENQPENQKSLSRNLDMELFTKAGENLPDKTLSFPSDF